MKAKSGRDGSSPAKLNTCSKKNDPTPSAAVKEAITVPIKISG
jgi:hypothetical protein